MKALLKRTRTPGEIELADVDPPRPGPGQLLARVAYAGICQSDLDIIYNRTSIYRPPVVPGHEFSAVVEEVGPQVEGFQTGDSVTSETALKTCGVCQACRDGFYEVCSAKQALGWTDFGGFAQYVVLNTRFAHKLTGSLDLQCAALIEPLAVAAETVLVRGRMQPGEVVAVVGPGTSGLLSALVALVMGAAEVYLVGRASMRHVKLPIARGIGLAHCVDSTVSDPRQYLLEHNEQRLADLVVDATGTIEGFNTSLQLVKRHGRISEVGSITGPTQFDWPGVCHKAIDLAFVFASSSAAWTHAVTIAEQHADKLRHFITHTMPLSDYREALSTAADGTKSLKVLLKP